MKSESLLDESYTSSLVAASKVTKDDTPRRLFLKRGIRALSTEVSIKKQKFKEPPTNCKTTKKENSFLGVYH